MTITPSMEAEVAIPSDVKSRRWSRCLKCGQSTPQTFTEMKENGLQTWVIYQCDECGTEVAQIRVPRT